MDIKIFKYPGEEHHKHREQHNIEKKAGMTSECSDPRSLEWEFGGQYHIKDTGRGLTVSHDKEFAFPSKWDGKLLQFSEQVSDII